MKHKRLSNKKRRHTAGTKYLSPVEFATLMTDLEELPEDGRHLAMEDAMMTQLVSLGYGAGVKTFRLIRGEFGR